MNDRMELSQPVLPHCLITQCPLSLSWETEMAGLYCDSWWVKFLLNVPHECISGLMEEGFSLEGPLLPSAL